MVLLQPEDIINLYGFDYKMVTIVAVVRNIDISSTKYTYELEDLTGKMSAHLWVEEEEKTNIPNIMLNSYVRVVGAVRSQNQTKSIMLFKIQPVHGINEVNTHYLEVINARYMAEEYSRGGKGNVKEEAFKMEVDEIASAAGTGLKGKEDVVFKFIMSANDGGKSRDDIEKNFPKITATEINTIIERLVQEGNIYTTIDQDHFSACF